MNKYIKIIKIVIFFVLIIHVSVQVLQNADTKAGVDTEKNVGGNACEEYRGGAWLVWLSG